MKEHISYAMRNEEAAQALIYFNSPSSLLDWTHVAVEWIFIIGIFLTVGHAIRYSKKTGSASAIYTLTGALIYGLVMDILSYYTVENFWHAVPHLQPQLPFPRHRSPAKPCELARFRALTKNYRSLGLVHRECSLNYHRKAKTFRRHSFTN